MKRREGYKRIAIRVAERGVYVEHTLSERRNQWRAPARLWASFFFFKGICSASCSTRMLGHYTRLMMNSVNR